MTATTTRRERLRTQTLAEIREHGYAQIARSGPAALSLNGIAKAMGMSGPALYRYFPSRDALLATLVTESYDDLAATLVAATADVDPPDARLRAAADAYRGWALAHPHRYHLVFASPPGSGALDPEHVIPAAHRAMGVLLTALTDLGPADAAPDVPDAALAAQLAAWAAARSSAGRPGVLLLGLVAWTRMHGVVSLEIEGVFDQVGVDPALLFRAEVDHLVAQRAGTA